MRMRTSRGSAARLAAVALLAGATTSAAQAETSVATTLESGGHVQVLSAYLRDGDDPAVVRGMVRRATLWRGPVDGHLHVTAYDAAGAPIARVATRWRGRAAGRHAPAMPYEAALGVSPEAVARLSVAWRPGDHDAEAAR